jgi:hypothetical protein
VTTDGQQRTVVGHLAVASDGTVWAGAARDAGYDAELTTLKGGNHTSNTEVMVSTVMETLGR